MASIDFVGVSVASGDTTILEEISFSVADGELVGIIGPSGSGKTTLIRTVAGLEAVASGTLLIDGADSRRVPVAERDVAMVHQDPALFLHRNVQRNVAFPLEIRRQTAEEIRERVGAETRALHLEHLLTRQASHLSRGEAQLVQIARALVRAPRVLLLDEPLASLDEQLQRRMRAELSLLQGGYGVTTIMTTNDPIDAVTMPSRLVALDHGRVVQSGTVAEVRDDPVTLDVAMSTGEWWTLPITVHQRAGGLWLVTAANGRHVVEHRAWTPALQAHVGRDLRLGFRPEDVTPAPSGSIDGVVIRVVPGAATGLYVDVGGHTIGVRSGAGCEVGQRVSFRLDQATVFDGDGRRVCRLG